MVVQAPTLTPTLIPSGNLTPNANTLDNSRLTPTLTWSLFHRGKAKTILIYFESRG